MLFPAGCAGRGRAQRRVQSCVKGTVCRVQGQPPEKGMPELSGKGWVQVSPGTQAEVGIPAES